MKNTNLSRFGLKTFLSNPLAIIGVITIWILIFLFIKFKFVDPTIKLGQDHILIKGEMGFSGKILDLYDNKGFTLITLSDSLKLILPHSRNYNYESPYLSDFLLMGDSINKMQYNDTLIVYRGISRYYFVLGKVIERTDQQK
jgi:hypothetical protein